jgi:hypothetical protein
VKIPIVEGVKAAAERSGCGPCIVAPNELAKKDTSDTEYDPIGMYSRMLLLGFEDVLMSDNSEKATRHRLTG